MPKIFLLKIRKGTGYTKIRVCKSNIFCGHSVWLFTWPFSTWIFTFYKELSYIDIFKKITATCLSAGLISAAQAAKSKRKNPSEKSPETRKSPWQARLPSSHFFDPSQLIWLILCKSPRQIWRFPVLAQPTQQWALSAWGCRSLSRLHNPWASVRGGNKWDKWKFSFVPSA